MYQDSGVTPRPKMPLESTVALTFPLVAKLIAFAPFLEITRAPSKELVAIAPAEVAMPMSVVSVPLLSLKAGLLVPYSSSNRPGLLVPIPSDSAEASQNSFAVVPVSS